MSEGQTYRASESALRQIATLFQSLLNKVFNFLSLTTTHQFWGIVYDAVSKQPLDPVIVKLVYSDGREAETVVTDLNGGYGFLAQPGKFKILAHKANYVFPSVLITGSSDGIYENLYHGEFFDLTGDSEVVAPTIPMDPVNSDWNQEAKSQLYKKYPFIKLLLKRLIIVAFWFGFISLGLLIWSTYPDIPFYYWLGVGAYILIIGLSILVPEPRLSGRFISSNTSLIPVGLFLELHNSKFPQITFGKAQIRDDGKFLLRGRKGNYELMIFDTRGGQQNKVLLASLPVKVGKRGVFNGTVYIK